MPSSISISAVLLALVAALSLSPVAPEAGNVIFLAVGGLSILLMFPRWATQIRRPVVWMPLLGLVLIALSYGIGGRSFEGLIGLAFFAPVFAVWPLLTATHQIERDEHAGLFGILALGGVAGAAVIAMNDVAATGTVRAGESIANPIHFADVALLVGFLACTGMLRVGGKSRYLFLLGPLLAAVAVILSGTRGAVVAVAVMVAIAGVMIVVLRLVSVRSALITVAALVMAGLIAALLGAAQLSGIQRVLIDIADVLRTGLPTDSSTDIRLGMMRGGWEAFLLSPVFGHGPLNFTAVANEFSGLPTEAWPHLHNDLVDFAASAGILGLFAYVLLMAAPIIEVARMPRIPAKAPILVLISTLIGGFFVMGLTNAMFGILTVTTTYAAICVITGILVSQASSAALRADAGQHQ